MTIKLCGIDVQIDDEDYERIMSKKWHRQTGRYFACTRKGGNILLHRFIINAPKGTVVDHKSGDTNDNRKCNLRLCTTLENCRNRGMSTKNSTGFRGVGYMKGRPNEYNAYISVKDKPYFIGSFATPEAAAYFREMAVKEIYGEFYRNPGYIVEKPVKIKNIKPAKPVQVNNGYQVKISGKVVGVYATEKDAINAYCVEKERIEVDRAYKQFWSVIARIRGDSIQDNEGITEMIDTLKSIQKTERLIMENGKATSDTGYKQFSETKDGYMKIIFSCHAKLKADVQNKLIFRVVFLADHSDVKFGVSALLCQVIELAALALPVKIMKEFGNSPCYAQHSKRLVDGFFLKQPLQVAHFVVDTQFD